MSLNGDVEGERYLRLWEGTPEDYECAFIRCSILTLAGRFEGSLEQQTTSVSKVMILIRS